MTPPVPRFFRLGELDGRLLAAPGSCEPSGPGRAPRPLKPESGKFSDRIRSAALRGAFALVLLGAAVARAGENLPIPAVSAFGEMKSGQFHRDGPLHLQLEGLEAARRYELRAYTGPAAAPADPHTLHVFWGESRPIQDLCLAYQKASGSFTAPSDVLPCPLPDALKSGNLHRSWRTGRELMETGLDIDRDLAGSVLWITYRPSVPAESSDDRILLEGEWRIVADPGDVGRNSGWNQPSAYPLAPSATILVPGNVNEVFPKFNGVVWYAKTFSNRLPTSPDLEALLRFKACSYQCEVWLNGVLVGSHEGAEAPFAFTVTGQLKPGDNTVILRVFFPKGTIIGGDRSYPDFWGMGGLTQGVDLVAKPRVRIADVFVRTDWKTGGAKFETAIVNTTGKAATVEISAQYGEQRTGGLLGSLSAEITAPPGESVHTLEATLSPFRLWSLDDPFLYHVAVSTRWKKTADTYNVPHFGFRDFRISADGYFELNGKRVLLKSTHGNVVDPLILEGTPRDMTWLGLDFELLKAAGFNTFREITYSALPEQLDLADELGFLIYNEHQASWLMKDPAKFEMDLPGVVRRDRNHPSLVIWGMLNELGFKWAKKDVEAIYEKARDYLPKLRAIDDTRLVLLSSGRFDLDLKTGSASNPGSSDWNIYLGGEDAHHPVTTNALVDDVGSYRAGAGDVHVYELHPISWPFIESMANLTKGTKPIFLSEGGQASAPNPLASERNLLKAGPTSRLSEQVEPEVQSLRTIWSKYGLSDVYPNIEDMIVASQKMAAEQRATFFSIVRSNPAINGYNLTSLTDGGDGEGILDEFRHLKTDHFQVMKDGWAKLRWCLLVNPANLYAGQSLRLRVSLADEDDLPPGTYPAVITVSGPTGSVWSKEVSVRVPGGDHPPLAYQVLDEDVTLGGLVEAEYTLSATLQHRANAKADSIKFKVTDPKNHPDLRGREVTLLGIGSTLRNLLTQSGVAAQDYAPGARSGPEVILVGDGFKGDPAAWSQLYDRVGAGAFAVFLSREILADENAVNTRLPLDQKGYQAAGGSEMNPGVLGEPNIFRSDIVARHHPIFSGLSTGVLTPEIYGALLRPKARFSGLTVPQDVAAAWIDLNTGKTEDGLVIGIYSYKNGKFLINSLDLIGNIGNPAADRIILNMIYYAGLHSVAHP